MVSASTSRSEVPSSKALPCYSRHSKITLCEDLLRLNLKLTLLWHAQTHICHRYQSIWTSEEEFEPIWAGQNFCKNNKSERRIWKNLPNVPKPKLILRPIDSGISPHPFCLPSEKLEWINQFLFLIFLSIGLQKQTNWRGKVTSN